jgi:hypothetical protein
MFTSWSGIFDGSLNQLIFALKWESLYLATEFSDCVSQGPWQDFILNHPKLFENDGDIPQLFGDIPRLCSEIPAVFSKAVQSGHG